MNADQMNGLYPIIRRVRRPLVGPDGQPVDGSTDARPPEKAGEKQAKQPEENAERRNEREQTEQKQS
jgi:hypothetical protein